MAKKKGKAKAKASDGTFKVLDDDTSKIRIQNVRLSFPHLFTPQQPPREGSSGSAKFSGTFLLDNEAHADAIEWVQERMEKLSKDNGMKKLSVSKSCMKPGEEKDDLEGFEGCHFISASNARRPLALDKDKSALSESDGKLYAGCYVNVIVQLWAQDNQHGKRINASLEGVQFEGDGEALGGGSIADEDDFE